MCSYRKVGGLRFLRLGRFQVSWCWCRKRPASTKLERQLVAARQCQQGRGDQ